jgi:hypothetical protein
MCKRWNFPPPFLSARVKIPQDFEFVVVGPINDFSTTMTKEENILQTMHQHPSSSPVPFLESSKNAPGKSRIISKPVDEGTIETIW